MRFTIAVLSLVAAATAQSSQNSFNIPPSGNYLLTAGQPQTFTWSNPSSGTVTILLREGANSDLKTISTLASNYQNSGSFTWNVPSSTPEGANYALEIISDSDNSVVNYTPQFVIQSDVKAIATSGASTTSYLTVTSAASSQSAASTGSVTSAASAQTTGSASSSASSSASQTGSSTGSSSAATTGSQTAASTSKASAAPSTAGAAHSYQAATGLFAVALFAMAL